jgi:N-glycosylase/DNA lyase
MGGGGAEDNNSNSPVLRSVQQVSLTLDIDLLSNNLTLLFNGLWDVVPQYFKDTQVRRVLREFSV